MKSPINQRPDLNNKVLNGLFFTVLFVLVLIPIFISSLPADVRRPGSFLLQSLAALGSLCLLAPFAYSFKKRSGKASNPNKGFVTHVLSSIVGTVLVCVHAFASFSGPPILMLLSLFLLIATGMIGRVWLARSMAATLGSKSIAFVGVSPSTKDDLRAVIELKKSLLAELDSAADEALFSVTMAHWLRSPLRSYRYSRLASREARLIGNRKSVSVMQAWWRPLHMILAWGFLIGLLVHVGLALFFASYVADGRDIYWWYIRAW